jgi:hypothetical protein
LIIDDRLRRERTLGKAPQGVLPWSAIELVGAKPSLKSIIALLAI